VTPQQRRPYPDRARRTLSDDSLRLTVDVWTRQDRILAALVLLKVLRVVATATLRAVEARRSPSTPVRLYGRHGRIEGATTVKSAFGVCKSDQLCAHVRQAVAAILCAGAGCRAELYCSQR